VLFRDAGFSPRLAGNELELGPEQLAVVGYGEYAGSTYDLGAQDDVVIPLEIHPLEARFEPDGTNAVRATFEGPNGGNVRILFRQSAAGKPVRTSRGAPPDGTSLGKLLTVKVLQGGTEVPTRIQYDEAIWSGLSWAVAETMSGDFKPHEPMTVRCVSSEERSVELKAEIYIVRYGK